jgi:hypothetical protein
MFDPILIVFPRSENDDPIIRLSSTEAFPPPKTLPSVENPEPHFNIDLKENAEPSSTFAKAL